MQIIYDFALISVRKGWHYCGYVGFCSPWNDSVELTRLLTAMPAGAFIGANIGGYVSDRLGRKKSLLVSIVFWIVGCILACAAQDVAMLVVGRIVKGVTVGWTRSV